VCCLRCDRLVPKLVRMAGGNRRRLSSPRHGGWRHSPGGRQLPLIYDWQTTGALAETGKGKNESQQTPGKPSAVEKRSHPVLPFRDSQTLRPKLIDWERLRDNSHPCYRHGILAKLRRIGRTGTICPV
jgi:hypothetical protein